MEFLGAYVLLYKYYQEQIEKGVQMDEYDRIIKLRDRFSEILQKYPESVVQSYMTSLKK